MNRKSLYTAVGSFVVAAALALAGLSEFEFSYGDTFAGQIHVYPAVFFALLGLLLLFLSLRSILRKRL